MKKRKGFKLRENQSSKKIKKGSLPCQEIGWLSLTDFAKQKEERRERFEKLMIAHN